jgi:hypothetical protein
MEFHQSFTFSLHDAQFYAVWPWTRDGARAMWSFPFDAGP